MSYFVVYAVSDGEPTDGPSVATGLGWKNWSDWVLNFPEKYPEAAHLAQEGWNEWAGEPADLEHELEAMLHDAPDPDRGAVAAQLLAALRGRPANAVGLLVTDGDAPDGESPESV